MQRDFPYQQDRIPDRPDDAHPSALDRPISIAASGYRWITIAAALVAAALLRLPDLDGWPLSAAEGSIALAARGLVTGETMPDDMLGMPATVEWVAMIMFAGETVETVGRISMAIAGLLLIAGVVMLGRWIGWATATASVVLLAASPTMIAASRALDGGILLPTLSLALFLSLLMSQRNPGMIWPALAGVSGGLLLLSGPLGIPATLLTGFGFVLLARPASLPVSDTLVAGGGALAGTILLAGSAFLTRLEALPASLGELFARFWSDHLSEAGQQFHMVAFNLLFNEPLILLLAVIALVARAELPAAVPLALWSAVAFVVMSLLGPAGSASYTLVVLPLALLAGTGAVHLIRRLSWAQSNRGYAGLYVLLILLLGLALLSVIGLLSGQDDQSAASVLPQIALILAIVVLPIAVAMAALGQRITGVRIILLATAAAIALSGISTRSAALAAAERHGSPGSILTVNATSDSVQILVDRLDRISRDVTLLDRDVRDPTGGHGLRIAIDERIEQPFAWYFREYPNVTIFDPAAEAPPEGTQVILMAGSADSVNMATEFESEQYALRYETPDLHESPDWGNLAAGVFDLGGWRRFGNYLLNRELSGVPAVEEFQVLAIPSIAERLFPDSGPYALDERPGAGAADGQFNQPRGVAAGEDGSIYVVDSGNHRVQRFTPEGEFDQWFGGAGEAEGEFGEFPGAATGGPGGISIGPEGNLYVADTWNHRIQVFTPEGEFLRAWGSFFDAQDDPELAGTQPGRFYGPRGIEVHDGMVFVTDTGNERVQVFDLQGEFIRMFGTIGSENGQLTEPVGITVGDDGTVFVADSHNARIARFTADGEPLDPWPVASWEGLRLFEPYLSLDRDGNLYASTSTNGEVVVFSSGGEQLDAITGSEMARPFGITTIEEERELLITDGLVNAVLRIPIEPL